MQHASLREGNNVRHTIQDCWLASLEEDTEQRIYCLSSKRSCCKEKTTGMSTISVATRSREHRELDAPVVKHICWAADQERRNVELAEQDLVSAVCISRSQSIASSCIYFCASDKSSGLVRHLQKSKSFPSVF